MMDNFLEQKSKVCPCFCSLNETHTSLKCLLFVSHFFDSLQGGHLPKLDTKSCSLPFFSHFIWHSIRPMRLLNGHLELVPAVLQSFPLTLYKTEIPLNRKASVGPCRFFSRFLKLSIRRKQRLCPCRSSFIFLCLPIMRTPPLNGHLAIVPAVLQLFPLTVFEADTFLW